MPECTDGAVSPEQYNVVLITADDMNWDSSGVYGCPIPDITPNIDRLASQGIRFMHAHSTVPVCQPVRATMMTGLYPQKSGVRGFEPLRSDVVTVNEVLHNAGYLISCLSKNDHYMPRSKYFVDYDIHATELIHGRDPQRFYEHTLKFIRMADRDGRPFFHHANPQDPHRPFAGSRQEKQYWHGKDPLTVRRTVSPSEVPVPGFLEDLPGVREELAQYFTCVYRFDECVGAILRALKETGHEDDTLVILYVGDHGMAFPYAKSNVFENSSHAGLMMRWPGRLKPGSIDENHFVSSLDITPTILDAVGLQEPYALDGQSLLPLADGKEQPGRDVVYTVYYETNEPRSLPMRCIRTRDFAYIWNGWAGHETYNADNVSGLTWKAMKAAAGSSPDIAERVQHYKYRCIEEFYDLRHDPFERENKINCPECRRQIDDLRRQMHSWMVEKKDPYLDAFNNRYDPKYIADWMAQLKENPLKGGPKIHYLSAPVVAGNCVRGGRLDFSINYRLPENVDGKPFKINITFKTDTHRILEKVVEECSGSGAIKRTFSIPSEIPEKAVYFNVWIGEEWSGRLVEKTTGKMPLMDGKQPVRSVE